MQDVRDCKGFFEVFATCIDDALTLNETWMRLRKKFPDAQLPTKLENLHGWLKTPSTWQAFSRIFDRDRVDMLWCKYQAKIKSDGRAKKEQRTLDQMLEARVRIQRGSQA